MTYPIESPFVMMLTDQKRGDAYTPLALSVKQKTCPSIDDYKLVVGYK